MEDKLRRYVDGLFAETIPTKKSVELKEEMIQNLQDKYRDLIGEGKTQDAAYNIVIAGIGDVSGLLDELESESRFQDTPAFEAARHRSAMLTSIAVMMYILSFLPIIVLGMLLGSDFGVQIGVLCMFVTIAAATGILVYNNMTKPKSRSSATVVEEFRQWQDDNYSRKSLRRSVSAALWTVTIALYLIFSFWSGAWHVSWIIFIIAAAAESFINLFSALRK